MQKQVVIKSDNSIILTAPVMIPDAPDCDYNRGEKLFTTEEIKAFKEAYDDYGFIDDYHAIRDLETASKSKIKGKALKSFILGEPTEYTWFDGTVHTYPEGTWMLTSEITDPVTIKDVQEGRINGYSPSIFTRKTAEKIRAALKESSSLKASAGSLIKDIVDPVPTLVSLVNKPCQHGNKFCKNNVGEIMSEDKKAQSKLNQIMSILGGNEPEYAVKEDIEEMKEYVDSTITSALKSDDFKESIKSIFDESLKEALKQPSLKETKPEDEEEEEEKPTSEDETSSENKDETKNNEEEEEEEEEKPKAATKSDSKSQPLHDGGKPALKSDKAIIMGEMGRDLNGRPSRK